MRGMWREGGAGEMRGRGDHQCQLPWAGGGPGRHVAEETHAEGGGAVINVNFRGREGALSSGVDSGAEWLSGY